MKTFPQASYLAFALAATLVASGCSKPPQVTDAPVPATVAGPATPSTAAVPAATSNVSDVDVTEHVKTALLQSELLKGLDITVVTIKGDVRLIGTVGKQAQIDEANRITRAADGVHSVHDELTIKK